MTAADDSDLLPIPHENGVGQISARPYPQDAHLAVGVGGRQAKSVRMQIEIANDAGHRQLEEFLVRVAFPERDEAAAAASATAD
jgi:hypothetical protein